MKRTVWWSCALVAVVACKGKDSTKAESPEPSSVQARETPTPVERSTERKVDPAFVSVDGDQLRALCLASLLPRTDETPNYGALVLADGKRVAWLSFTTRGESDIEPGGKKVPVLAADWRKQFAWVMELHSELPSSGNDGRTKFRLCGDGEIDVVVSGVFMQKDGVHLVTARGKNQFEKVLPAKTPVNDIYAAAFDELEKHVGQSVKIASHKVTDSPIDNSQSTISDERWQLAAK
jgi:hypothetical protein